MFWSAAMDLIATRCPEHQQIVALYQRLHKVQFRLNHELVKRLSKSVILEGARKLGMCSGSTIVFDTEAETPVLLDYCIYDVRRGGRNAFEQYLADESPPPDSDEMTCLKAMQRSTFALAAILDTIPGVGCQIRNLFNGQEALLADVNLSRTANRGTITITRLLDFGTFLTTGGAPLPGGILNDEQLAEFQQQLSIANARDAIDPAALIRQTLKLQSSVHFRYATAESQFQNEYEYLDPDERAENVSRRNRERSAILANRSALNQRCRCGSGKMFKNCCLKKQR